MLTLVLGHAPGAHAQGLIGRSPRAGELGAQFLGTWRAGSALSGSMDGTYRQWIRIPLRGVVYDPRILAYNLTLAPSFSQRDSRGLPSAIRSRELSVDFGARLLSTQPVSFAFTANRAAGSSEGGFGSEGDFTTSNWSGVGSIRIRALPLSVTWSRRSRENTWLSGAGLQPIAWSNITRTFRVSAQNTKTNAKIERVSFDDRLGDGDFDVWNASLVHQLRWGRGSRLRSSLDRSDRRGANTYLRETWSERLHLQHDLGSSDLSFQRHRSETAAGVSRSRTLGYSYSARINRWLTVGARASGRTARASGNRETVYSAAPNVSLNLRLPSDVRLAAGGAFGYETRDRERSEDRFVEVINERHAIDEARSFLLDQTDVDPASVIVRSSDETIVFIEDVDYRIVELDRILEVVIIPGGRIDVGTVVLVSYRFDPVAFASGNVITGRYDFSLRKGAFTLRHSRSLRDGGDSDGDVLLGLGTFDEIRTSLSGVLGTPVGRWELDFQRNSRTSSAFDFTSYELRTSLALPTGRGLQWTVGATGRKTRDEDRRLISRSAHTTASWKIARSARLSGRIQAWDLKLADRIVDRSISSDVSLQLRIHAVETIVRFVYSRRSAPSVINTSRLTARLVRRF